MSSTCNSGSPGREAARSTGLFLDKKKWKDEKKTHLCTLHIILWDAKVNWRITWVPDLCVCSQCQGRPRGWWSWRAWSAHGFEPEPETKRWSGYIFSLLARHLFDVTVKCGENGHVHDGAAKVDVDTDDHNPMQCMHYSIRHNPAIWRQDHSLNEEVSATWDFVSGLPALLGDRTRRPSYWILLPVSP